MKQLTLNVMIAFVILVATLGSACSPAPVQNVQGYENSGSYMEPDHGYFYYWLLYHSTFGYYRPSVSYHVYLPPAGYPPTYRPWYGRTVRPTYGGYTSAPGLTPNRATGGFSGTPQPSTGTSRTGGGFAAPAPSSRTGGGFSSAPRPAAPAVAPRTGGGFSSAPRSSSTPSPSRSSGGFSSGRRR